MKVKVTLLSEQPRTFEFKGRMGWMITKLIEAGPKGVTPISHPAPRHSSYVHSLREIGVPIETIMEPHHGSYPGTHARYVLRCDAEVHRLEGEAQA